MHLFAETVIARVVVWNPTTRPLEAVITDGPRVATARTLAPQEVLVVTTAGGPVTVRCASLCVATARVAAGAAVMPTTCQPSGPGLRPP